MSNKLNSETLRKIAEIKKEAEKLRDVIKRLQEKIKHRSYKSTRVARQLDSGKVCVWVWD